MATLTPQGLNKSANLWLGDWSSCSAATAAATPTNEIYLGMVKEGVLELSREDAEYMNTGFPQKLALIVPQRAGMRFTGRMDELHSVNLGMLVNNITTNASNYIYPGTQCSFEDNFLTFWARRRRCDGNVMEARFYKAMTSGLVSIGSGEDASVAGTPFEIAALDDTNGEYGGSSSAPLGFVFIASPEA